MKKKLFILIILLLFTTGCTCEYNLKIEDNIFKEQIKLTADSQEEMSAFNKKWEISAKKDQNVPGGDPSTTETITNSIYKYNLSNSTLTFDYNFSQSEYNSSTAISKCYNNITITNYQNSTIISTPSTVICFDNYPSLDKVIVNVIVDRDVKSNNADGVNGNTYTWNLTRENANDKTINMVIVNSSEQASDNNNHDNHTAKTKKDYSIYIFCGILLLAFLLGYIIFSRIRNKGNNMDV